MPIVSEAELKLSISNSNRDKSHSEGSNRHIYEAVQGHGLGNVAKNPPTIDELLEYPPNVPQRGGNSEILQWMESSIIQNLNQKDKGLAQQK
ncbi:hypothetical protein O181_014343 [Austropuccinia psidii MF-1]|uniref:Uncharacterized protein n=1 Tax=Austropuccinia psidii MF-1 TaxID=1389203 RepID=A0A9Q3C123_9BASI|nr:hypothetical protein [Austropuccinia psidii MF-1]